MDHHVCKALPRGTSEVQGDCKCSRGGESAEEKQLKARPRQRLIKELQEPFTMTGAVFLLCVVFSLGSTSTFTTLQAALAHEDDTNTGESRHTPAEVRNSGQLGVSDSIGQATMSQGTIRADTVKFEAGFPAATYDMNTYKEHEPSFVRELMRRPYGPKRFPREVQEDAMAGHDIIDLRRTVNALANASAIQRAPDVRTVLEKPQQAPSLTAVQHRMALR